MTLSANTIEKPALDFAGLLYAPNAEVGVYLVMGLLWNHLPYTFAMEAFELDPKREGHSHTKYLDAKAKVLSDGAWKDVTMEFKLYSSGLRHDLLKHPGLKVDFLVCWIHDAPDIEPYAENILELEKVYRSLPSEDQKRLILNPAVSGPSRPMDLSGGDILGRFSTKNQSKIQFLIQHWPQVIPRTAEFTFMRGRVTVFRACAYSSEHLIITVCPKGSTFSSIASHFGGEELQTSVRIPLDNMVDENLAELVSVLRSDDHGAD